LRNRRDVAGRAIGLASATSPVRAADAAENRGENISAK
jgi:hypothetical protein